jgi:chemotaxis protein CheD
MAPISKSKKETESSDPETELRIGIGELVVAKSPAILRTLVGSCVGIALYDPLRKLGGMAHVVHPESNGRLDQPGKYADTAIPELIRDLTRLGGEQRRLVAKYAGGAKMLNAFSYNPIGDLNAEMIERILTQIGIPVLGKDCGGKHGRRLAMDLTSGTLRIEAVGQPTLDL